MLGRENRDPNASKHGAGNGKLLPAATAALIQKLSKRRDAMGALGKLASAAESLTGSPGGSLERNLDRLVARLEEFARIGRLPGLGAYGITADIAKRIASEGNNKNSPAELDEGDRLSLLESCL